MEFDPNKIGRTLFSGNEWQKVIMSTEPKKNEKDIIQFVTENSIGATLVSKEKVYNPAHIIDGDREGGCLSYLTLDGIRTHPYFSDEPFVYRNSWTEEEIPYRICFLIYKKGEDEVTLSFTMWNHPLTGEQTTGFYYGSWLQDMYDEEVLELLSEFFPIEEDIKEPECQ